MTRAEAVTFLSESFAGPAATLAITATDDATGWKAAIDAALRALGVSRAELATRVVATADHAAYEAALTYFGLRRMLRQASDWVQVSVGQPVVAKHRQQFYDHLSAQLAEAASELATAGVTVPSESWTTARVNLDFLEPALEDA